MGHKIYSHSKMPNLCTYENCRKRASFAVKFQTPIYCSEHGLLKGAKPQYRICKCGSARPNFGFLNDTRPTCCVKCKTQEMCDIMNNQCEEEGCTRQPSFGLPDDKATHCGKHKATEMIRYNKTNMCKECSKSATFGIEGTKPEYCKQHKKENMVDLSHNKCKEENCKTRANFGFEGESPEYCSEHKKENMFDITHRTCNENGCSTQPVYGYPNTKSRLYCNKHKKDTMVDLSSKLCNFEGCNVRGSFGYKNKHNTDLYCVEHKKEEMLIVSKPLCSTEGCTKYGSFKSEDKINQYYCKEHKQNNMLLVGAKKCEFEGCKLLASFGFSDQKIQYCSTHKKDTMINLATLHQLCPDCPLNQRGNPKYSNYCTQCFIRKFPTDPRTFLVRKKSDEIIVRDFLYANFPTLGLLHDQPLWTHNCECNHRRRIDLRTLIGNTMLAIEVDEYQHKHYDEKDEEIRYDDVFMIHSGKWVFIRFNPHLYKNEKGLRVNPQRDKRLAYLKSFIEKQVERITNEQNTELLEIHKLFYDGFKL